MRAGLSVAESCGRRRGRDFVGGEGERLGPASSSLSGTSMGFDLLSPASSADVIEGEYGLGRLG